MTHRKTTHAAEIADQFTRQAERFARSPALHNEAALTMLVDAAEPMPSDTSLDVACGPGTVVAAFARRIRRAEGLDATEKMLAEARKLVDQAKLANTIFHHGDVYGLPFPAHTFDIVSCRFAVHHFEDPPRAFAEMLRVCRPGGRVVLCDGLASDDPEKAAALNRMEVLRDPSTVEFRTLAYLEQLFRVAKLPNPKVSFYLVVTDVEALVAISFPANGDREGLRQVFESSVDGDKLGMNLKRDGDRLKLSYQAAILVARKPER